MGFYLDKSFSIDFGTKLESARSLILGVPFDSTTTAIPGSRQAPLRVREAFFQKETANLNLYDLGNLVCVPANITETGKRVEYTLREIRKKSSSPIFTLGGEHLITYWTIKILEPDILLVFDAHFDLKDQVNGEKYTHCTFLRRIIEETNIRIIVVGGRAFDDDEKLFVEKHKEQLIFTSSFEKINEICKDKKTYISVDVDVFDPVFAPGTGTPESNGLDTRQFFNIFENLNIDLLGGDVVEINPLLDDKANRTSVLAADVLFELIKKSQK